MKYYLHDTNAFSDEKVTELFLQYGYEGLGLFYTVLEKIAAQEKPIKTSILKKQLQVGKRLEKCWSFMEEIGIISSSNGETFNERILSYSEKYKIQKDNNRKRVEKFRKEHSENKGITENVTHYVTGVKRNGNASKVKESKVKVVEGIVTPPLELYKRQLLSDQIFLEKAAIMWYLSLEAINKMIEEFAFENLSKEKEWKDYNDFKNHFFSWGRYDNRYQGFKDKSTTEEKLKNLR
jgi:hypothetical protein